ncbi:MAG: LysR substrate-binding domain-containing protein [Pseudomonadota bacterium]
MAINVTHLRSFWQVARAGGFSKAAIVLGVSQPTLTKQVAALERSYGVSLLERTSRSVQITAEGERLFAICEPVFNGLEEAEQYLKTTKQLTVRLNAVHCECLGDILAEWRVKFPRLRFDIGMMGSTEVLEAVTSGESDFGLLTLKEPPEYVEWFTAGSGSLVAFPPAGHPWSGAASISLSELANAPIILGSRVGQSRQYLDAELARFGIEINPVQVVDSLQVMSDLVRRGIGVAVTSETGHDHLFPAGKVPFNDTDLSMEVHLICRKEKMRTAVFRSMFEVARSISESML